MTQAKAKHPILYSFRRCPYAMRARLALAACKKTVILREVLLRDKPKEMLDLSPKGTVPVLHLPQTGEVIDESREIMIWAAKDNPDHTGFETRDGANQLLDEIEGCFKFHLDRYKYPSRYKLNDGITHRDANIPFLSQLDKQLETGNSLDQSGKFGLIDYALMPFIRQYAHTDRHWFYSQNWPHLLHWLNQLLENEIFSHIMQKYTPWRAEDPLILFSPEKGNE